MNDQDMRVWASLDFDHAAAFAVLHESAVWMLTLEVDDGHVLDLTDCGLDVTAVATDLLFAGISASTRLEDERHPQSVLRRVSTDAIRAAGYRVVRTREWIDWGAGERHTESVLIVDPKPQSLTGRFSRCLIGAFNSQVAIRRATQEGRRCPLCKVCDEHRLF